MMYPSNFWKFPTNQPKTNKMATYGQIKLTVDDVQTNF